MLDRVLLGRNQPSGFGTQIAGNSAGQIERFGLKEALILAVPLHGLNREELPVRA
jgi:hypothetical protein